MASGIIQSKKMKSDDLFISNPYAQNKDKHYFNFHYSVLH